MKELKDTVTRISDNFFSNLKPLDASALQSLSEKIVVFTPSSIREEMEPERFRRLIKDLETTSESVQEWKKVFEFLHDLATSSSSAEAFHNEVVRKSRTDTHIKGKVSGSYGLASGKASASFDQTIEKDYKDLTDEEKKVANDLRDSLLTNSIDEGKIRNYYSQKFAGEDFVEGTRPKPWSVYLISSSMLQSNLFTEATKTVRLDALPVKSRRSFQLDQAVPGTPATISNLEQRINGLGARMQTGLVQVQTPKGKPAVVLDTVARIDDHGTVHDDGSVHILSDNEEVVTLSSSGIFSRGQIKTEGSLTCRGIDSAALSTGNIFCGKAAPRNNFVVFIQWPSALAHRNDGGLLWTPPEIEPSAAVPVRNASFIRTVSWRRNIVLSTA